MKLRCAAADIPIDVISCILSFLPVKSVLRFKCVSKSWHSLISDPHFKKLHLLHSHKSANLVLVFQDQDSLRDCDAPLFDDIMSGDATHIELPFRRHLQYSIKGIIMCSCDGLLLMRNYNNLGPLTLWNPSTDECRILPTVECDFSSTSAGLGYDSSTDDYKVLFRPEKKHCRPGEDVMILSLKTNCWRKINFFKYYCRLENGINLKGSLNWAILKASVSKDNKVWLSAKIVSFSLANETTTEMEHPRNYPTYSVRLKLGVLQGCLCLTETAHPNTSITIWLMKEFGVTSSWTKLITTPHLPGGHGMDFPIPLPLNHMNKTVFLIHKYRGAAHFLIINDLEAEKDYRFVKIANTESLRVRGLTFSRSLTSPN
ncbi:F-box protein CPR1-like [Mercurialis annua]|uniref:F-box protein CPR1-like n=1 Tax=Mercurialis annua TaxID=3986 RepID=UPI0024AEE00D|nr:F-box protein CPR1-like [Mercurialis annua]